MELKHLTLASPARSEPRGCALFHLVSLSAGMKWHFEEHRLVKKQKLVAEQAQPNLWDPQTKSWIRPQKAWL